MDDVMAQLARLLTDRPLCIRCLRLAANLEEDTARCALDALAATVLIIGAVEACARCKATKKTFRMPVRP
jgi:hypothetical protein